MSLPVTVLITSTKVGFFLPSKYSPISVAAFSYFSELKTLFVNFEVI